MKRFRIIGMDWFDVVVHVGVTMMAGVTADALFGRGSGNGASSDIAISMVVGASLILLGYRRQRALARLPDAPADAARVDEMEARLGDLEEMQLRMAELEERVDFAERLLTRVRDESQLSDRVP
jgi:hypothetical protein